MGCGATVDKRKALAKKDNYHHASDESVLEKLEEDLALSKKDASGDFQDTLKEQSASPQVSLLPKVVLQPIRDTSWFIQVRCITGEISRVMVNPEDTIRIVKARLRQREDGPLQNRIFKLVLNKQGLHPARVADSCLSKGAFVDALLLAKEEADDTAEALKTDAKVAKGDAPWTMYVICGVDGALLAEVVVRPDALCKDLREEAEMKSGKLLRLLNGSTVLSPPTKIDAQDNISIKASGLEDGDNVLAVIRRKRVPNHLMGLRFFGVVNLDRKHGIARGPSTVWGPCECEMTLHEWGAIEVTFWTFLGGHQQELSMKSKSLGISTAIVLLCANDHGWAVLDEEDTVHARVCICFQEPCEKCSPPPLYEYCDAATGVSAPLSNVDVLLSTRSAFAVLKKDGSVVTWGSDKVVPREHPIHSKLASFKIARLCSTDGAFGALTNSGSVLTWGEEEREYEIVRQHALSEPG